MRCFLLPLSHEVQECKFGNISALLSVIAAANVKQDVSKTQIYVKSHDFVFLLSVLQVPSDSSMACAMLWLLCLDSQAEMLSVVEIVARITPKLGGGNQKAPSSV